MIAVIGLGGKARAGARLAWAKSTQWMVSPASVALGAMWTAATWVLSWWLASLLPGDPVSVFAWPPQPHGLVDDFYFLGLMGCAMAGVIVLMTGWHVLIVGRPAMARVAASMAQRESELYKHAAELRRSVVELGEIGDATLPKKGAQWVSKPARRL